jgi:hypothetical protein
MEPSGFPIAGVVGLTVLWFALGWAFGVLCGRAVEWLEIERLKREIAALQKDQSNDA